MGIRYQDAEGQMNGMDGPLYCILKFYYKILVILKLFPPNDLQDIKISYSELLNFLKINKLAGLFSVYEFFKS